MHVGQQNQAWATQHLMANWRGGDILDQIDFRLNRDMLVLGRTVVQIAKRYSPVRTGHLRDSLRFDYNLTTKTLTFISDVPYDIFQEFGTRNMNPHPHWRPAINTVGPVYGYNLEMTFSNIPHINRPILAQGAEFKVPPTLTPKQMAHVQQVMAPTSKRHYISNVSRTRMNIRKYF